MDSSPRWANLLLALSLGSLACQMTNPAFNPGSGGETRGNADSADSSGENGEGKDTGDGDPSTGDGDPSTGDGDPTTDDGDPSTGDGDPTTGDGDGDGSYCGDGVVDPGEECDDGNIVDGDGCEGDCTWPSDDGPKLDMMEPCAAVVEPVTCFDCVSTYCCEPAALQCVGDATCKCVLDCLLEGQDERLCFQQICQANDNDVALASDAFACVGQHCSEQCSI